jgi:hypothetical protein
MMRRGLWVRRGSAGWLDEHTVMASAKLN